MVVVVKKVMVVAKLHVAMALLLSAHLVQSPTQMY